MSEIDTISAPDSAAHVGCAASVCSAFQASVKDAVLAALWNFERSGYTPEELSDEIADILDPPRIRSVVNSRAEIEEGMRDAWKIIDVLYMDALDHNGESWPRAREWQEKWARFKPNTKS